MTVQTDSFILTGERDDLLASLVPAERYVAKVRSNPAITGIRIVWKDGEGYVEATNLNTGIRSHLWGAIDADEVDVIVSTRVVKALQSLPQGEVTLSFDGNVTIKGKGRSKYEVGIIAGSWPNFQSGAEEVEWDEIPVLDASEVMDAMEVAAKFASKKENQPTITGVNVRSDGDRVRVASTDSHRLFTTRVDPNEFWQNEEDITVPATMVNELRRLFPSGEIKLSADDNMFFVSHPQGGMYFSARRLGGKFPEVAKLFPKPDEFQWDVGIPRKELLDAVKRIRFMAEEKPLKLQIEDDELMLTAQGDSGVAEEFVDLPFEHKKIAVGFNSEQIVSVLDVFEGDEVRFRFISPLRPALVTANGEEPEALLMPIRISGA